MSGPSGLARLGICGERGRRAQERLGLASAELVVAVRRALPFLTRKRIGVIATPPRVALFSELAAVVPNVAFTTAFVVDGDGPSGVLAVDAAALSRILDGVLGGGDVPSVPLEAGALSSAQSALAARVSSGVLRAVADVLRVRLGLTAEQAAGPLPADAGACVVVSMAMAGGGTIALAVPLSALANGVDVGEPSDGRMAAAMVDVEVDVVAELGKVRIPLAALASLAVGDVLPLSLSLEERASVCAGGAVLFRGRPTASGLAISIAIERHAL